jgi:hypothetical protein
MTFSLDVARRVVAHYSHLIGKSITGASPEMLVHYIAIVPADDEQYKKFANAFYHNRNSEAALQAAGFNPDAVSVELFSFDGNGNVFHRELDRYLVLNNMERVYLNPDFSANPS